MSRRQRLVFLVELIPIASLHSGSTLDQQSPQGKHGGVQGRCFVSGQVQAVEVTLGHLAVDLGNLDDGLDI